MKKKLILSCIVGFLLCLLSVIPIYASECSHVWETVYRIEPDCLSKGSEMKNLPKIVAKLKPLVSQFLIILGENGKLQLLQTVHILALRPALVLFVTKLNKKDVPTNGIHSWSDWKTATNICTEEKKGL